MNWNKKDILNICKIVAFGIILYWGLQNITMLGGAFRTLINILIPFIAGAAIAFIINIPMTIFEKKIFVCKKKKCKAKKITKIKNNDNNNKDNIDNISELEKKLKFDEEVKISKPKRAISIILSIALLALILAGAIFLIIPELIDVIAQIINYLPQLFSDSKEYMNQLVFDYPEIEGILINLQQNLENFNTEIIKELTTFGTKLVTSSFGVITSTIGFAFDAIIAIIFAIYILVGKEKIVRQLKRITYAFLDEKKADKICEIVNLSKNAFNNFITGQFTECIILGTLCAIGMLILRLPYSAIVGTLVAITAFVPIVGALIGGFIGVILLLPISFTKALVFLIFFIILQQTENNVIYPRVVGNSVGLPGIVVLLAISVGGTIGGALGMVISLPVTSVIYALLRESTNRRLNDKISKNCL